MSLIEALDTKGFQKYLQTYRNTICGRHPIGVLLNVSITIVSTLTLSIVGYRCSSRWKVTICIEVHSVCPVQSLHFCI